MSFFDFPTYDIIADHDSNVLSQAKLHVFVFEKDYGEESENLLTKILAAAKQDIGQTPVHRISDKLSYYPIKELPEHSLLISFDVEAGDLGLNCDIYPYRLFTINKKHYLFCDSLEDISKDGQKKKLLWSALKSHFNL